MRARIAMISFALIAGCSSQADKQLEAVKSARSVLAEWSTVETQAAKGRAQTTYTEAMRKQAKDELEKAAKGLAQRPDAAKLIDGLRSGAPDAAALERADTALEPLEKSLEAA
jgi:hypothetical protein